MIKVALVNCPIRLSDAPRHAPMNLGILSSVLKKEGMEVDIIDINAMRIPYRDVFKIFKEKKYDVIGIGGVTTAYNWIHDINPHLKKLQPDAHFITGGYVFSSMDKFFLENNPDFKAGVWGEGELTLPELIKALINNEDLGKVDGIWFRDDEGDPLMTEPRELIKDYDTIPYPDFDNLLLEEVYFKHSPLAFSKEAMTCKKRLDIITIRGCPNQCNFCYKMYDTVRASTAKYYVNYMIETIEKYGVDFFSNLDENMLRLRKRTLEICELIESESLQKKAKWGCLGDVKSVDEEVLNALKNAGCTYISFGGESMSQRSLDAYNKKQTPVDIRNAVEMTENAGINATVTFMVGAPGETPRDILASAKYWKEKGWYLNSFFATPYPGTELYDKYVKDKVPDLQKWICELDDATKFSINMTKMSTAELIGFKYMAENHMIELMEEEVENWELKNNKVNDSNLYALKVIEK